MQSHCRGWSQRRRMLRSAKGLAVVDARVARNLQRHQWLGVRWMYRVANGALRGCILADEPGLGKTIQALALIDALIWSGQATRVLVICPATVVHIWKIEASKWLQQRVTVVAIQRETQELHARAHLARLGRTRAPQHLMTVVSFETLEKHRDVLCGMGQTLHLKVVDEAHRCAHDNLTSRAVVAIPAERCVLLSATPLANSLREFFYLASLAQPRIGGYAEFVDDFERPISAGRASGASEAQRWMGEVAARDLAALTKELQLRRTNAELARGLPPSVNLVVVCRPTTVQRSLHCVVQQGEGAALTRLHRLLAIHNHPRLLSTSAVGGAMLEREMPLWPQKPRARLVFSGKLQVCAALLESILQTSSDKVVVIGSSVPTLGMVNTFAASLLPSGGSLCLSGSVSKKRREQVCTILNNPKSSLRVLCVCDKLTPGLTLIGANHLILLNPTWNPATDQQSRGRIHRPGQDRMCYHYTLVSAGSVEETILERQVGKLSLLETLREGKMPSAQSDDSKELFALDPPSVPSRLAAHVLDADAEDDVPPESYTYWSRFEVGVGASSVDLPQPIKPIISALLIQPQDVIASIENMELVADGDGENEGDDAACEVTTAAPAVGPAGGGQLMISYIFYRRSDAKWMF